MSDDCRLQCGLPAPRPWPSLLCKVQSVDQRMRLEFGVGFRQLRDVPSHTSGADMELERAVYTRSNRDYRIELGLQLTCWLGGEALQECPKPYSHDLR